MNHDFASLVAPLSVQRFLAKVWLKAPRHFPAKNRKRFAGLLPWAELNRILHAHRLEAPHLRLWKSGEELPRAAYLRDDLAIGGVKVPSVNAAAMHDSLRDGASLILNGVEHLTEPVGALAQAVEEVLQAPTQVNAYASWAEVPGFDTHWDDHDVFILQVAGRKKWRVFEPTSLHPLFPTHFDDPPGAPVWEGVMRAGDVLYIPRGWWHDACAMGEPTLHLTFGPRATTGLDILETMTKRFKNLPALRREVPRFGTKTERAEYLTDLKAALQSEIDSLTVEGFWAEHDGTARVFEKPSLPWAIPTPNVTLPRGLRLTWVPRRKATMTLRDGLVHFSVLGSRWALSEATLPVLKAFATKRTMTFADACKVARQPPEAVSAFIGDLLRRGLLSAR